MRRPRPALLTVLPLALACCLAGPAAAQRGPQGEEGRPAPKAAERPPRKKSEDKSKKAKERGKRPGKVAKGADYYPLKVGATWHYRAEVAGLPVQSSNTIARVEKDSTGRVLAVLESWSGGQKLMSEHLSSDATGVYRHRFNGQVMDPPICLLRYPVKDKDEWETPVSDGINVTKVTAKATRERVRVPAGVTEAVRVELSAGVGEAKAVSTYWFAPGVGVVKQQVSAQLPFFSGQMVSELERVEGLR